MLEKRDFGNIVSGNWILRRVCGLGLSPAWLRSSGALKVSPGARILTLLVHGIYTEYMSYHVNLWRMLHGAPERRPPDSARGLPERLPHMRVLDIHRPVTSH